MLNILSRRSVLITGGSGFIGANLTRKLLSQRYSVSHISKKSSDLWRIKDILDKVDVYHADLLDQKKLTKIVNRIKPEFIIHLATYSDYRNQNSVEDMIDVNIKGTLNLLLASRDINYKLFINTGSSSEYGIKNKPMSEKDLPEPVSFYAATKASATILCQVFAKEYKKSIVTLRPFSVFGPYEEKSRFIPTIIKAILENKPIKLTPGNQRRDFIYVDDIVDIYVKTMNEEKKLSGQVLNMGTGIEYTNDEVVKTLFKITGKRTDIEKGAFPVRLWDTPHWVADITKTKRLLKWKPQFDLEKGLRETYLWFKKLDNK